MKCDIANNQNDLNLYCNVVGNIVKLKEYVECTYLWVSEIMGIEGGETVKNDNKTLRITRIALLIAMQIILSRFLSIATPVVKIGFAFVPLSIIGMLYGPMYSAIAAGIADYLGSNLFPIGAYHPGFTITSILVGLTYGIFLQKKGAKSFLKIIVAVFIINIVLHLGLNTYWISTISGKGYLALLPTRVMSNVAIIPIQVVTIKFVYEVFIKKLK